MTEAQTHLRKEPKMRTMRTMVVVVVLSTSLNAADSWTRIGAIFSGSGPSRWELQRRAELAESNRVWQVRQQQAAMVRWQKSALTNDAKVLAWDRTRAERGEASGQYDLGMRYLAGRGVTNSPSLAREWLAKSAGQGHAKAKAELARINQ